MMRSRFVPIVAIACMFALSACANTVRGAGKDVNNTVDAVEDTVR